MLRVFVSIGFLQAVAIVINAVRAKVFAVLLGPAGLGVVATIDQLVVSVSQFFHLSLPKTALRFLSRDHSLSEERFRRSYAHFLQATVALAMLAPVVLFLFLPSHLASLDPELGKYRSPVSIALLGIPATMLVIFFVHVFAARQKPVHSALVIAISAALGAVFGTGGCLLGGISGIYLALVPASTALAVLLIWYARARMNLPLRAPAGNEKHRFKIDREIVETGAANYIAIACYSGFVLFTRYLSIAELSEEAAGFLQAGLAIALSVGGVLSPVSQLYLAPNLNRVVPTEVKNESIDRFLPRLVLLYSVAALPVMLFPEFALKILFSDRFIAAANIVRALLIWQCLFQIATVYQQHLIGFDHIRVFAAATLAAYVTAGALSVALTGSLGLNGIAVAFAASALIIIGSAAVYFRLRNERGLPKQIAVFNISALLGLTGTIAIGNWTSEVAVGGILLRLSYGAVVLLTLFALLPKSVRAELFESAIARTRELLGRKSPALP